MKNPTCSRLWQVEAVHDGRLQGKDLESALRHQATCAECSEEAREVSVLARQLSRLPELSRDPLTTRRSRQHLIAALNESVIDPVRPARAWRVALGVSLAAAIATGAWLIVVRSSARVRPTEAVASIIDVTAQPGTRWSEQVEREIDRVDLAFGAASFKVHPHEGRRVVIRLPDGEIEDLGTVFEIRVAGQHTEHVAVSEGRVSVRLHGRLEFSLSAGNAWNSETATPAPSAALQPAVGSAVAADLARIPGSDRAPTPTPGASSHARRQPIAEAGARAEEASQKGSGKDARMSAEPSPDSLSTKAEDDAYLGIVELLRQAKYSQARAQAKSYLLRFPNGFRRVEVLNIATRAADDADDGSSPR
jgi:ferric-dicitrate binding protein FerR (iron transport regulator)